MDDDNCGTQYEVVGRRKSARLKNSAGQQALPLPKTTEPSEVSHPKLTPGIAVHAAMPNTESVQQIAKPVRGPNRRNKSIPLPPMRRSSRLSKSSTALQDAPGDKLPI